MQSINLDEFNAYIINNRFISGNEIAWFKSEQKRVEKIGLIILCDTEFEAITYKRSENNLFWLDKFQKFGREQDACDFIRNELEK